MRTLIIRTSYLFVATFLLSFIYDESRGQVLDGVFIPEHTKSRKVTPWTYTGEIDVMWQKRIWREIDLREKQNQKFYYPVEPANGRKSLIDVILDGLLVTGTLSAYNAPFAEDFSQELTIIELEALVAGKVDTVWIPSPDPPYQPVKKIIREKFNSSTITKYRVKEEWFFDREKSIMDVRIIGICPIVEMMDDEGNFKGNKPLFWVYFPEARELLIKHESFNRQNDVERRTYDDIFWKRQFASYIYKESNVYDRKILRYAEGLDALLEADKIKYEMITKEIDYWSY